VPGPWRYWILHSRLALAISDGTCGFSPDTVPRLIAEPGSSSRRLHASSEYSRPVPAPRLSALSAFHGVAVPLRDLSLRRRHGGFPGPPSFRPRRFSRPRRFDPPPALRVCFTPQPRPGFHPSGVFPLCTAAPSRRWPVPSRRLAVVTCWQLPTSASFHGPALRALFRAESPLPKRRCYPTPGPIPSWAFSSSRYSLFPPPRSPSRPRPLMALAKDPSSRTLCQPSACCQ
jgi:hypothetical protein